MTPPPAYGQLQGQSIGLVFFFFFLYSEAPEVTIGCKLGRPHKWGQRGAYPSVHPARQALSQLVGFFFGSFSSRESGLHGLTGRKHRPSGHLRTAPSPGVMPAGLKYVGLRGETIRHMKSASVKRTWEDRGQKRRPSGEVWVSSPLGRVYE